ncbi:MAG: M50 family metallopeptidase [Streptosporangiaceae bacterium]
MEVLGWAIFLFALLFSVMLHETGHFVMAKAFGMKATRYFVGFGPTIWSTRRGETEYGIKAIPLGGFVKIVGMHSLDDVHPDDELRAFRGQTGWQRIIVLSAGSFMHFLLAFVLIGGLALGIGIENENTTQLGTITSCVASNVTALDNDTCSAGNAESPAKLAGLRVGDTITGFDGKPASNWTQLGNAIRVAPVGSVATITVLRAGKTVTLHAKLAHIKGRSGAYLGVAPTVVFQTASPIGAITYAGSAFWQVLDGSAHAVAALPEALPKLFNKKERADSAGGQVTSVYGAAEATGQAVAADVGWQYKVSFVLLLIASLNIFVGVFNMLPLLPLDGGHIAIVIWERIRARLARLRGRPDPGLVDISKVLPICFSIFMIVMCFGVLLIVADIVNPLNVVG